VLATRLLRSLAARRAFADSRASEAARAARDHIASSSGEGQFYLVFAFDGAPKPRSARWITS
jgi:hypothetical protein